MRVLIIHNQLWTHYKAKLFSEIHTNFPYQKGEFLVAQIGLYEKSRATFGDLDYSIHQYPYQLLFDKSLQEITFIERLKALFSTITNFKPTVVNFTGYYDLATWPLIFYCKLKGIKLVLSNESTSADQSRSFFKELIKKIIIMQFDVFFCFGTKSAKYLETFGVKSNQIAVTNAAVVDNDRIEAEYKKAVQSISKNNFGAAYNLREKNFIFVGRFVEVKNLSLLIRAFSKLNDLKWGLILLGNGQEESNLKNQISVNKIDGITFISSQKWTEIPQFLALGNIFVLPSFSETWGLVVNEAMVCGLPVIVSDQCGCSFDLIEGKNTGEIFKSNDVNDLLKKMIALKDKDLTIYAENAKKQILRYSPKSAAQAMIKAFENL